MAGRACTANPFLPGNWSPTVAEVDARPKQRGNWATIRPTVYPNHAAPTVTERDRASIAAAMHKVRRFDSAGREIA
ncbi:hypothetical protein E6C67_08210 [Azospirillum sp. TSA2s]|uniref:hypothetical protein n=1 Tax=Azospirillum sp. TSA2s TaxID=709810 RepID=UPI0010A9D62F|nr:hypothetical protein [Azospirillum sp. TSA2s]QCG93924.1 hypothetical protein E6C67_08210 [Azospirillum sp. TSA2s]